MQSGDDQLIAEELLKQIDANGQLKQLCSYMFGVTKFMVLLLFGATLLMVLSGRGPTQRIEIQVEDNSTSTVTTKNTCLLWGCNSKEEVAQ